MAIGDGPIKTFPLRGIKDSPPYLHDGRLLTLEDTVEFHNLVLETKLTEQEKKDLVAFLHASKRRNPKHEIRSTKSEARNPKQIRIRKVECSKRAR